MILVKDVRLILEDKIVEGDILFSDKIVKISGEGCEDILESGDAGKKLDSVKTAEMTDVIDGEGMYLSPGFIDIHMHGSGGYDTMDANYQALNAISVSIASTGVTSFLPTTMTMKADEIRNALDNISACMNNGTGGARIIGAHLEGPFINPDFKGAQDKENIVLPDACMFADYYDLIKIVTLAPEMEGAEELIGLLNDKGIIISAGHTGATYEEIVLAEKWGVSHFTHLFNAMTGLHHRKPGTVGAALSLDLSCEIIADFIHLHPAVIQVVLKSKDRKKLILVTDQMRAGTLEDGEYNLGGQKVFVKEGAARLGNGQLAGSILTLDQAVRNITEMSNLDLPEVIQLVTLNPARLLKIDDRTGRLAAGYRADLVMLDENLQVNRVFIGGREFKKDS